MRFALSSSAAMAVAAVMATAVSAADYSTTVTGLNPVAYYRLSETNYVASADIATNLGSLGSGLNGTYFATAVEHGITGALAGNTDTAIKANAYSMSVPYSEAYNPAGAFTVEAWLKPASDASGLTAPLNSGLMDSPRTGWLLYQNGPDGWSFRMYNQNGTTVSAEVAASVPVVANTWYHFVATYDGTTARVYIDGVEVATAEPAGTPAKYVPNTTKPLAIGARTDNTYAWTGSVDELAVYTTALSAADVKAHYDNGTNAGRTKSYSDLVLEKTPSLYFRLNEPAPVMPVAKNLGSWGASADATYFPGCVAGVAGAQKPAFNGFETNNLSVQLNGVSGTLRIPAQTLYADTLTWTAWVRLNGVPSGWNAVVLQRGTGVAATGFGFGDANELRYHWNDGQYDYNPGLTVADQAWTFIAAVITPTEAILCVNNTFATNAVIHDPHDFSAMPIFIGQDPYGSRYFNGLVDEVAFFDKALTADELTSLYQAALPAITAVTRSPANVYEGMTVTFQAAVASTQAVTYQWFKDGQAIAGETSASLVLNDATVADGGNYHVQAATGGITLTSPASELLVQASAPILSQAPESTTQYLNGTARFSVACIGSVPQAYQWKHGADVIPGATSSSLVLTDLQPADAGEYTVVISNALGSTNATATLSLLTPSKLASAVTDAGPIGYWRLDETSGSLAFDYWGGRNGRFSTGVATNVAGPRPAAYAGFDASNTAYEFTAGVVTVPPLNLTKATMTIVVWIKPKAAQPDFAGLVFNRSTGGTSGLDYQYSQQLGYHWNDAANTYGWASGLYPTEDQWNFVALVVEPDKATMYLDAGSGLQSSVNEVSHAPSGFGGTFVFGWDNGAARQYQGAMDDVAVYDRALSEAEITVLRNAGYNGTYTPDALRMVEQPKSQTIMAGNSYTLSAKASGSVPITYQWQKDGQDIPGATRSSLSFASATISDSGVYQLIATQGGNTVASSTATLAVKPVPVAFNRPEDLVVHLAFDGDYNDTSGRNNNGMPVGTPQIVAGKVGSGAVRYSTEVADGAVTAANYISLGTPSDLNFGGATSFSISFWIKFTGEPGDLPFICNNTGSYGNAGFTFAPSYNTGSWSWSMNDGTSPAGWPGVAAQYGNDAGYAGALNDGTWHHVAHLVDRNGDLATYVDGIKVHAKSIAGLVFNLDTGLTINIGQDAGGAYPEAGQFEIDDLGIWRTVLSEYDAQAIYVVGQNYGRSFDSTAPPDVKVEIQKTAGGVELRWSNGTLESSDRADTGYTTVSGAVSPHKVEPAIGQRFYRVKVQ